MGEEKALRPEYFGLEQQDIKNEKGKTPVILFVLHNHCHIK